jgi:hypothetical protein
MTQGQDGRGDLIPLVWSLAHSPRTRRVLISGQSQPPHIDFDSLASALNLPRNIIMPDIISWPAPLPASFSRSKANGRAANGIMNGTNGLHELDEDAFEAMEEFTADSDGE